MVFHHSPYVQLQNVDKIYYTTAGEFPALVNVSIDIHQGEFVSVVGHSGSGKSTLMNMITGIDKPSAGEILISGSRIDQLSENQMAKWRGKNLGIVFQFYQLIPVLSLQENVMLSMQIANQFTRQQREERAMTLLDWVGLSDLAHKRPHAVSGGQQQSAAIARALANDPPIVIADEPTGNLDSNSAANIIRIFERLSKMGKTIIMVTHDIELASHADRVLQLSDGILTNHINQLKNEPPQTALEKNLS